MAHEYNYTTESFMLILGINIQPEIENLNSYKWQHCQVKDLHSHLAVSWGEEH